MADTKLSALSAASSMAVTDKLYVVQTTGVGGVSATPLVLPGCYAGIYIYDGVTAQTIATGTTPTLLTGFNTATGFNGLSSNCTPVKTSNKITVTVAGTYMIAYSFSYAAGTNNIIWEMYAFNAGTRLSGTGAMSKTGAAADTQCISGMGFAAVAANTDIDLRGYHNDGGNVTITPNHANLTVVRVGP
jgi:hypothetical protein